MNDTPKPQELSFEQSFQRLEQIVQELENGKLTLDEMLARFEEGIQLSQQCNQRLEAVEKKIEVLVQTPNGNRSPVAYEQD